MKPATVTLTVLDTAAAQCVTVEESLWYAQDEDGQCDCVRAAYFGIEEHDCGESRFVIIAAAIGGEPYEHYADFNTEWCDRTPEQHARIKALLK